MSYPRWRQRPAAYYLLEEVQNTYQNLQLFPLSSEYLYSPMLGSLHVQFYWESLLAVKIFGGSGNPSVPLLSMWEEEGAGHGELKIPGNSTLLWFSDSPSPCCSKEYFSVLRWILLSHTGMVIIWDWRTMISPEIKIGPRKVDQEAMRCGMGKLHQSREMVYLRPTDKIRANSGCLMNGQLQSEIRLFPEELPSICLAEAIDYWCQWFAQGLWVSQYSRWPWRA